MSLCQVISYRWKNSKNNGVRFINRRGNVFGLKNLLFGNPKVQGASSMFNRKLKEICFPLPVSVPLHDLYISYHCYPTNNLDS